ncbi:MAG: hypothetical protein AAF602_25895, partial [Myxococcota bacterium]
GFYITLPGRGIDGDLDPRELPAYRSARVAATSVEWQANAYGRLGVARPLVSTENSALRGVGAIEFDADWVIGNLLPRPLSGDSNVGGVLLDRGATVVAATDLDEARALNPRLWEAMAEADPARSPGYRIERQADGTERLYVFHRLNAMDWTHVIYGPLWRLTKAREPVVPGVGASE